MTKWYSKKIRIAAYVVLFFFNTEAPNHYWCRTLSILISLFCQVKKYIFIHLSQVMLLLKYMGFLSVRKDCFFSTCKALFEKPKGQRKIAFSLISDLNSGAKKGQWCSLFYCESCSYSSLRSVLDTPGSIPTGRIGD